MTTLYADLETYCETPITAGTHKYSEDAEILLFAYALDDGPVNVWDCASGALMPDNLVEALDDDSIELCFHNSHFDRTVLRHNGHRLPLSRFRDTMVKAMAHSLPGALAELCDILRVPMDKAKDKDGKRLIQLFCKPRPKTSKIRRATRETHPEDWAKFVDYARLDIEAMRAVDKKLPKWNYGDDEIALWHLDQRINDRGFAVDMDLVHGAIRAVAREQHRLAERTQEVTEGAVQAATQRDALLDHLLETYGYTLPDMQGSTLERVLKDDSLPAPVRELIEIRLQASTTSTSKYKTLAKATSSDGKMRGTLQFNGASRTCRWAGRLFQPQNLPRPTLKQKQIDFGIEALKADCEDLLFDNVMELTSSAVRGCIIAPAGRKLVVADLSNIEGRVLAWLAGEHWKLQAFRDFDAGNGPDLYKLAYAKSFGITPEAVTKDNRQVGKVQELALGYEGGVGAFLTFAAAYAIDLEAMGETAIDGIPSAILEEARSALEWTRKNKRPTFGLSDRAWLVCDSFKRGWRQGHPAISSFWKDLESAAREALNNPGRVIQCRMLKLQKTGAWLRIRLPSGRYLCYPSPQLDDAGKLSYMGINQYTRKWERLSTYGGKLAENVTQAVARDVLASSMPHVEEAGYEIVLTVHDEIITEAPDTPEYNCQHLAAIMATNPPWARGLPLAAAGFEGYRYRKD